MKTMKQFDGLLVALAVLVQFGCMDVRVVEKDKAAEQPLRLAQLEDLHLEGEVSPLREAYKNLFGAQGSSKKWRRVFLKEGTQITTLGQDFILQAESILAPEATLRTFSEEQAQNSQLSLPIDGGKVVIRAEKVSGTIHFELRGREGRQGNPGRKPVDSMKGVAGAKGRDAVLKLRPRKGCPGTPHCHFVPHCAVAATSGAPGGQGKTGGKGGTGGRGGDTAELLLQIKSLQEFRYSLVVRPGQGGSGGIGGEGGVGGLGGLAGKIFPKPVKTEKIPSGCQRTKNGEEGARGAQGPSGDRGADGKRKPIWKWTPQGYESL